MADPDPAPNFNRTHPEAGYCNRKLLQKGPNGRNLCRKCQTEVPYSSRTFCSEACVHEWRIRSDSGYAASTVLKRDHGICCLCGVNCLVQLAEARALLRQDRAALKVWLSERLIPDTRIYGKRLWDMDHTVPVVEGGGTCALENLRTLCIKCHKGVTSELAARRASARKASKALAASLAASLAPGDHNPESPASKANGSRKPRAKRARAL